LSSRAACLGQAERHEILADDLKTAISSQTIAILVCYQVAMIAFILGLGIRLATFFASAGAFFSARNRPGGSAVAAPCCLPQRPRGRENALPARRAGDLAQMIDGAGDYRKDRALCENSP
jgi:hypothetical protein